MNDTPPPSKRDLERALQAESQRFATFYRWLEEHMPTSFFEEIPTDELVLIAESLMRLDLHDFVSHIHLKNRALTLCLDRPDADLEILKHYQMVGIKSYRTFVSNAPPPFPEATICLRVARIDFTEFHEAPSYNERSLPKAELQEIFASLKSRNPAVTEEAFHKLIAQIDPRFLIATARERLIIALAMFFRAKDRDDCQYEAFHQENWKPGSENPSMRIVLAWRSVPKNNFLYRLAKTIFRHNLKMKRVYATYVDPYSRQSILILSIGLDGIRGKAAWEEADIPDFLQELATLKYFEGRELIETTFVDSGLVRGNLGNLLKTMVYFVHQVLVQADPYIYALHNIEEALCRHPELTAQLTLAFELKFHPEKCDVPAYEAVGKKFLSLVQELDTGHEMNDVRRKNVLFTAMHFIKYTLKTNFYRKNKTAFSFRLDPAYLDAVPFNRKEKFPEMPYAIFFMKGLYYIGFHLRFRDLARGGLRTIFPERMEQMLVERNNVFSECYGLAYTQQKKNKDIPEGGAKAVIFLEPYERLLAEEKIYQKELEEAGVPKGDIEKRLQIFHKEQKLEYLHQTQRSYIECFLVLLNCNPDGSLRAKDIVDYWQKPEYIYLGPDENMHNEMIQWIADFSVNYGYKSGRSFISSKPNSGINHKEFGVTSFGVNVYVEEVLKYIGIDPHRDSFTVKMTGGPDGDVAGNQIYNLYRFFPKTAKLIALTDGSGTIFDPQGLDLAILTQLFQKEQPIRFYPPQKLSESGFLLDLKTKREQTAYAQQTLKWSKQQGKLVEEWLSGNEMNHLFRHNVHETKADIFIPAGGRPRTLNDNNWKEFLDETGAPTSKAIVEGANLYLTPVARRSLEQLGVLIIKDSSANKGGVICSSFEVLAGLTLSEQEFIQQKAEIVEEILQSIAARCKDEANLLLRTHKETGGFLTDISERISEKINNYTYQILDYLVEQTLPDDPNHPLTHCLINYALPLIAKRYAQRLLHDVPDIHKKAIIACYIASRVVYRRGLEWAPKISDVLTLIAEDPEIIRR